MTRIERVSLVLNTPPRGYGLRCRTWEIEKFVLNELEKVVLNELEKSFSKAIYHIFGANWSITPNGVVFLNMSVCS